MDKEQLLSAEVREFINEHESDELRALMLQRNKYAHLPLAAIIEQIKARLKAKIKLPSWYQKEGVLYPQPVSVEQSSSERTANWKAQFIGAEKSGIDLTGGFGVDTHYFAQNFKEWVHVEPNSELQEVVRHNSNLFGVDNITFANMSSEEYLSGLSEQADFIYIDPDRRPSTERVWGFKESLPQISRSFVNSLRPLTRKLLIKASPMIDIMAGLSDLEDVVEIIILGINNEVKEVLFLIDFESSSDLLFRCINIVKGSEEVYIFNFLSSFQEEIKISSIKSFLLEPNAAIMKSGGQDLLAKEKNLCKLHRNTNLYTTDNLPDDYPGRVFEIIANLPYKKKEILMHLVGNQANLSTRNFIDTPQQMKKKLGLKDGGNFYLFGYRDHSNRNMVALCRPTISS